MIWCCLRWLWSHRGWKRNVVLNKSCQDWSWRMRDTFRSQYVCPCHVSACISFNASLPCSGKTLENLLHEPFYTGSGDPNAGPHASSGSTLTTEPSPKAPDIIFDQLPSNINPSSANKYLLNQTHRPRRSSLVLAGTPDSYFLSVICSSSV